MCGSTTSPATIGCFIALIPQVIFSLISLIGIVTLFMILIGAFRYITAAGDEKQLDEARKVLVYASVGLVVVVFSFFIISLLYQFTGVTCGFPSVSSSGTITWCQ